jgi:hypothetical protein
MQSSLYLPGALRRKLRGAVLVRLQRPRRGGGDAGIEIQTGMIGSAGPSSTARVDDWVVSSSVIENVMAPQRNLILARLDGGPLAEAGVIAGAAAQSTSTAG